MDDPFNGGFQLTQSLIAIGRGSWFGVGLGSSVQKLFYLPEAHTDFVFAVLAEELGLVGVLGVIALFVALVWRAFHISRMAAQAGMRFQSYLALAFGIWLGLQASVNIGVNMGVLPTKGLTLPLLELWPQQPAGEPGLARRAAAHLSRGQVQLALRGDAHPGRRADERRCDLRAPVLIMAGGTGGHVFPALAVAKVLRERGIAVVWLGVPGSMESRLVPANGFPIEWVRVGGIRGKGLMTWLLAPLRIVKAVAQALRVLRRVKPRSVLGARRLRERPGRHRGVAAADSAAHPRAERDRRHDQSLAGAPGEPGAGSISGQLRPAHAAPAPSAIRCAPISRRSRRRRSASRNASGARACWCSAAARARSD